SDLAKLGFEDFRALACDRTLTANEKIGFPESYRKGKDGVIFADIVAKLPALKLRSMTVIDIGPGCAGLAKKTIRHCAARSHKLVLVDSPEMLAHLPNTPGVDKIGARFPDCAPMLRKYAGKADAVIVYSVIHHVFVDGNLFAFYDR